MVSEIWYQVEDNIELGSAGSDLQGYAVHNACVELTKQLQTHLPLSRLALIE